MAKKIGFDPGHGGKDRWNVGPTGYVEADGVLSISLHARDELLEVNKLYHPGAFEVKLTRDEDKFLEVRERGEILAAWGADLAISEHTNATGTAKKASGSDVYESVDLNDDALADLMAERIAVALGIPNRGGKSWESENYPGEDYLGFIDAAQDGGVPHVLLIESAFHDNPSNEALLKQDSKRKLIAWVQAGVICSMYGYRNTLGLNSGNFKAIMKFQEGLKKLGYSIVVDGSFGPETVKIAKKFQSDNGLEDDGVVGPNTWKKFDQKLTTKEEPNVPIVTPSKVMYRIIIDDKQIMALSDYDSSVQTLKDKINSGSGKKGKLQRNTDSVDIYFYPEPVKEIKHLITGKSEVTALQMAAYLISKNPAPKINIGDITPENIVKFCQTFIDEGDIEGIAGDKAFCRSLHETGNFEYTGDVKPVQNNFAGIGTTGGGVTGASFKDYQTGIKAQVQHLKAYSDKENLSSPCVDPRFSLITRGIAPNWEDLNGKWAVPGTTYGQGILKIFDALKKTEPLVLKTWKEKGVDYLKEAGYIVSDHDPLEIVDMGTFGAMMKNRDSKIGGNK